MTESTARDDSVLGRRGALKLFGIGAAGAAGASVLAACSTSSQGSTASALASASGPTGKKGSLIWATHVYYNQPALIGISVGFRDFLDSVGWSFKVTAAQTASDVQETLQAQQQALQLNPTAIVATMIDKTSFNKSLEAIQKAGIFLQLNNTQPDAGNGLGIPYIGPSFTASAIRTMDQLLDTAVKNGRKSGTVLVGYCCQDSGVVGTLTAGYLTAVKQYNASNGTSFDTSQVLDTSDSDPSAANSTWQTKLQSLQGKNLVAIACSQVGDPVIVAAKALGKKPGFVPIATVNTTQDRLNYLQEGWMDVIIDQSVYAQGYIAAAQAWMYVNSKTSPTPLYDTGAALITKDTVSQARENLAYVAARAKQLGIQA